MHTVTDKARPHHSYAFGFLFPPPNHKQPKAGNSREGKEGDTVGQSRGQNQLQSSQLPGLGKPYSISNRGEILNVQSGY